MVTFGKMKSFLDFYLVYSPFLYQKFTTNAAKVTNGHFGQFQINFVYFYTMNFEITCFKIGFERSYAPFS